MTYFNNYFRSFKRKIALETNFHYPYIDRKKIISKVDKKYADFLLKSNSLLSL